MSAKLRIAGDGHIKIAFMHHVFYDHDTPFDLTVDLHESGAVAYPLGPAVVQLGIDGDTAHVGISVEGWPIAQKTFSLSELEKAPIPIDIKAVGDEVKATITLLEDPVKG